LFLVAWLMVSLFFVARRQWLPWLALVVGFLALEGLLLWSVAEAAFAPDAGNGASLGAAFLIGPAEFALLLALLGAALGSAIHFWRDSRSFGTGKND
jgi:hypothetical protein